MSGEKFKIKTSEFIRSSSSGKDPVDTGSSQFVFAGKSNVGKSSFINSVLSRKNLAKTGRTPGKTRLINYFLINSLFYFVDLPGYGYAQVSNKEKDKWKKMIVNFFKYNPRIDLAFSILDIRHDPVENDLILIKMFGEMNIPQIIVLNKKDKLSNNRSHNRIKQLKNKLDNIPGIQDIIPYSCKDHFNREKILTIIQKHLQAGNDDNN